MVDQGAKWYFDGGVVDLSWLPRYAAVVMCGSLSEMFVVYWVSRLVVSAGNSRSVRAEVVAVFRRTPNQCALLAITCLHICRT